MERTLIKNVKQKVGQKVKIAGWVNTIRDQGAIKFLLLRDVSGIIQAVITKESEEASRIAGSLSLESVVEIVGEAKEEKQAPSGIEIGVGELIILSRAEPELPIPIVGKGEVGETELQTRLDWRWIDLRKKENLLIFQIWTEMEKGFREYWLKNGYMEIHSPKLMGTPSESGAELFEVPYFDTTAYLAQSPQFYKQMAMASGFEKVFEVGPVFRADPSFTSRHATEFTGFDAEISFIESHLDVMQELENVIVTALSAVHKKYGEEIEEMHGTKLNVPKIPFPRITMEAAKKILKDAGQPSEKDGDLSPEEERKLCEIIQEENGHEFVFVTDYPISARPFYHMRYEDDPSLTKSFDLLWKGIEITTGAQREHRYEILKNQALEKGLSLEPIKHYLNFFRYGCPPHGGYGLGPGRMVMKILDADNIRKVTYVYRGVKRLNP